MNDPLDATQLLEQINLAFVSANHELIRILQRNPLERVHVAVVRRDAIHFGATAFTETVKPCVVFAVKLDKVAAFDLCRSWGDGGGRGDGVGGC